MNKKKLLALLMALVMTLTLVPVTALATEVSVASAVVNGVETNFSSLEEALAAADKGTTVKLLSDIDYSETTKNRNAHDRGEELRVSLKNVTLDLQQHSITTVNASVVFDGIGTIQNGVFTLNHINAEGKSQAGSYALCIDKPRETGNTNLALKNLVLEGGLNVWSAVVTVDDVTAETTASKYYAVWAEDEGAVVTINSGTFTDTQTGGKGVLATGTGEEAGAQIIVKGGNFNAVNKLVYNSGENDIQISSGYFTKTPEAYLADDCKVVESDVDGYFYKVTEADYVAQIDETGAKFETLEAAIAAANELNTNPTVTLLQNVAVDLGSNSTNRLAISKSMTIDGDGHTISINDRGFGVGMGASSNIDVIFKDVTIENSSYAARCIDTRGNLNSLTLDHVTLSTDGASGNQNDSTQPLTIGGNQSTAATISITNSTIQTNDDATAYYAIITFNPVIMNITNSTIKGWACIDAKGKVSSEGSHGSKFTISGSKLYSNNVYGPNSNNFATIMIEDHDVAVDITNTTIDIETTKGSYQGITGFRANTAGSVVNLGNGNTVTLSGNEALITLTSGNNPKYQNYGKIAVSGGIFNREIYDILCADGYAPIGNTDPATKVPYPYTVGKIQVTDYETATITTDQSSSVDNAALAAVVSDTDVQTTIKEKTVVSGVQLTNNLTVEDNATNGVQAVVDEAMKKSEFSDAMDTASKVEIEVDVKVTPKTFSEEAVTFKLTPVATVKTYASETADTPTSTVTGIAVDNNWIDQSQPITVQLYTNFLPSQIIHRDNDGNVIEVFTGNQIVYDATTGVATVTISHFSELEAVQYVAQIGDNKYATLKAAFDAAGNNDTIKLLADISLTERLFVNAGANPEYAGANNRYATTSEDKAITLDMNGHNIQSSSNIALAGGSLTITGTGKISTSASGLAPIEIRGTGDLTSNRTLTIGSGVTLEGEEYGLNVFGSNDAQKNLIDVNVNGTVNGTLFVLGNLTNTANEINIVVNGTVNGGNEEVGIALNGYGNVTVNGGANVSGKTGIEVRAGELTVNGGTITGKGAYAAPTHNGSGTTSSGAAVAVAQHSTKLPINVTLTGGTLSATGANGKAVVVADPEGNETIADSVQVVATESFKNNSAVDEDYEWVAYGNNYTLAEKPVKALGGSLRRRATNGGSGNIVYNETDLRFGFTVTDAGHFSTEKSYFTYTFGDYTSGNITATKIANDGTTNLVLTKVPANYFSTEITVTLHAFDKSGELIGTATLTKSVKDVAFALKNGENIDDTWKTYAGTIISENDLKN